MRLDAITPRVRINDLVWKVLLAIIYVMGSTCKHYNVGNKEEEDDDDDSSLNEDGWVDACCNGYLQRSILPHATKVLGRVSCHAWVASDFCSFISIQVVIMYTSIPSPLGDDDGMALQRHLFSLPLLRRHSTLVVCSFISSQYKFACENHLSFCLWSDY